MNEQQIKKQPYIRPVLKRIELKIDEVLVEKCSTQSSSGVGGSQCTATNCTGTS